MSHIALKAASRALTAIVILGIAAMAVIYRDSFNIQTIEGWTRDAGVWGPIVFIAAYIACAVLFIPATPITLAGGALFGPVWGTAYNLTGATIGAIMAFAIAKYLASDFIRRLMGGKLKKLYDGVESEGWEFVAFTRLLPIFPYNALNYALGLTPIKFSHYAIATFIFMIPGSAAYTYVGYAGREIFAGSQGAMQTALIAVGLVALVAFITRIAKKMRESPPLDSAGLKKSLDAGEPTLVVDVRDAADFDLGHVPGALNIPVSELESRLGDARQSANGKKIVFICRTDRRSTKAMEIAAKAGVDSAVVKGGMESWSKLGFPVEK